jgi:hypothetical protein
MSAKLFVEFGISKIKPHDFRRSIASILCEIDPKWLPVIDKILGHKIKGTNVHLATASANSMNAGKNPIKDGDLLLLELVTPINAGSISGTTMAVEIQDESGDNQYLLRVVKKNNHGQYLLVANNLDYPDMVANESMNTFARLKGVLT